MVILDSRMALTEPVKLHKAQFDAMYSSKQRDFESGFEGNTSVLTNQEKLQDQ